MPEVVNIDPGRGIAEIVAHDEVTIDQMKASQKKIAKAIDHHALTGLLYDGRAIMSAPDDDDLFNFAKRTIKSGQLTGLQFAILTSEESSLPYLMLAMPAAQQGQHVRVFSERQAALEWLGDGCENKSNL